MNSAPVEAQPATARQLARGARGSVVAPQALIVTALCGEVANAANLGGQLALGADLEWDFTNLLYPPMVSPSALTIAFLLAVFKHWVVSDADPRPNLTGNDHVFEERNPDAGTRDRAGRAVQRPGRQGDAVGDHSGG